MSTPRVPPVPPKGGEPDKTAPTTQDRKVEKIEKVDEIDDETRARQFRQFVEAEDEEETSNFPTPLALFTEEAAQPLSSPNNSPPPSTILNSIAAEEEEGSTSLPQSYQFWADVDDPVDMRPPSGRPRMNETPSSSSRSFLTEEKQDEEEKKEDLKRKEKKSLSEKELDLSPFGPPGKPVLERTRETGTPPSKDSAIKKQRLGPEGVFDPRGKKPKYVGPLSSEEKKERYPSRRSEEISAYPPLSPKEKVIYASLAPEEKAQFLGLNHEERAKYFASLPLGEDQMPQISKALTPKKEEMARGMERPKREEMPLSKPEIEEEEERGKGKKSSRKEAEPIQIESPTTTPLPEAVIPIAMAAASNAMPYLGPEALAIYMRLVGTIHVMISSKGDSRMEFILNAPGFANSKFYGSMISIERFATAPYQLNIRLTGSNEAIDLFNKNIPNLMAAFKNGNFSFTINRMETAYERPLFRRKEMAGEKSEQEFGGSMENRKR